MTSRSVFCEIAVKNVNLSHTVFTTCYTMNIVQLAKYA